MKYECVEPVQSEAFRSALRRFESGLFQNAAMEFISVLAREPGHRDATYYLKLIERKMMPRASIKPQLVWQFNPAHAWESDWIRSLLADQIAGEKVDMTWSHTADPMIVVDNRLVPEKVFYYREAFEKGCRIILVHLSDEAFKDDLGAYKYCDAVIRCYWSERLASDSNIAFLPLGYKAGFAAAAHTPKRAAERKYLWSFAGDNKKLTRGPMLEALGTLPNGYTHLTSGFGAADALSTPMYRALLDDTIFAACPSGWSNLETFRVYEALEAGCIPIIERRAHFDYFTNLLGPHPMPTIYDWTEGAAVIGQLQAANDVERVRHTCGVWWADYKPKLVSILSEVISRALK